MSVAYCYRSGELGVARREPAGAIALLRGPARTLRAAVEVGARHSYNPGVLLVPGIPEATDDDAALVAAATWARWMAKRPGLTYLGTI